MLRYIFSRVCLSMVRCRRGVASIEFIIVIPALFIVLFGGVEIWHYIRTDSRLVHAVGTLSDLVTRVESDIATPEDMSDMFEAFNVIIGEERSDYSVNVWSIAVAFDQNGNQRSRGVDLLYVVDWSQYDGNNSLTRSCGEYSSLNLPTLVSDALQRLTVPHPTLSLVVVDGQLTYSSPLGNLIANGTRISRSVVATPRYLDKIGGPTPAGSRGCVRPVASSSVPIVGGVGGDLSLGGAGAGGGFSVQGGN